MNTNNHYLFPPPKPVNATFIGEQQLYPVNRIFAIGRNYADHAAEMGHSVDRQNPFFFTKFPASLTPSDNTIPFPPGTNDLHHEIELVIALGQPVFAASPEIATTAVLGYAAGLDLTRRDLQTQAKTQQRPWDISKNFDNSAIIAPFRRASTISTIERHGIRLDVNGTMRQQAKIGDMIWSIAEIIASLSCYYYLGPGDLIFTGTPSGVGPLAPGDQITGRIDGLPELHLNIAPK